MTSPVAAVQPSETTAAPVAVEVGACVPPAADSPPPRHRVQRWAPGLCLWGPFAAAVALTFGFTSDDPMITLRYAANIVHGLGPVFNQGRRVEGFTSPVHLVIAVVVYLLPGGMVLLKAKLASLVFGVLAVRQAGRLIAQAPLPRWATYLALGLTGGSWIVALASTNGLETGLACWLTTMLICRLVGGRAITHWGSTALIAGLCIMVRPDAGAIVVFMGATAAVLERQIRVAPRIRWAVGGLAIAALSAAARLAYYGQLVPNTYFAKEMPLTRALTGGGLTYLLKAAALPESAFGRSSIPSDALVIVPFVTLVIGITTIVGHHKALLYAVAAVAAQACFIVEAGGDWMIGARFLAPVAPAIVVIQVVGAVALIRDIRDRRPGRTAVAATAVVAAMAAAATFPFVVARNPIWGSRGRFDNRSLVASGGYPESQLWLQGVQLLACAQPGELVAYSEVGYAGLARLDLRFLDTRGLVDHEIAVTASAAMKSPAGVTDGGWESASSPVGRVILQRRPTLVLSFDGPARPTVLDGRYVEVQALPPVQGRALVLYRRYDRVCAPHPVSTT